MKMNKVSSPAKPMKAKAPKDCCDAKGYSSSMEMTDFEKGMVLQEQRERAIAHVKYVAGIQGSDGGSFVKVR